MELKLEVENQSSKTIESFRIEFYKVRRISRLLCLTRRMHFVTLFIPQILIYKSNQLNSRRKTERIKMAEFLPGGCQKQSEVQYTIGIMVPAVPPTDLTSSSVCRVKYELQVTVISTMAHLFVLYTNSEFYLP